MSAKLLAEGDFNANLADPEGDRRREDIAAVMATEGLEDMSTHFLPRWRPWRWDRRTWSMIKEGREVRSRTDYILGTDLRLFGNVSVWYPRHISYHYMVLSCLHSVSLKEHAIYFGVSKRLPLRPPTEPTREDRIFAALRRAVLNLRAWEARKNTWILAKTCRIVDERVSARQDIAKYQALISRLGCAIRAGLSTDRKRRAEEAGAEVESLLVSETPLHREAWHCIKEWYKAAVDRALPPAWVTLERITAERVELYSYVPPPGTKIPIYVQPLPVDDSVPTEDKIEWAVMQLSNHRSGGASRMRAEHLKGWMATVRKSEEADKELKTTMEREGITENGESLATQAQLETEADNWTMVVDLIQ